LNIIHVLPFQLNPGGIQSRILSSLVNGFVDKTEHTVRICSFTFFARMSFIFLLNFQETKTLT